MSRIINTLLVLLLLLIQYGLWAGESSLGEYFALRDAVAQQRAENERHKKHNKALLAEIEDLRHGKEAIEERARNELGMIREGEVFYRVIED